MLVLVREAIVYIMHIKSYIHHMVWCCMVMCTIRIQNDKMQTTNLRSFSSVNIDQAWKILRIGQIPWRKTTNLISTNLINWPTHSKINGCLKRYVILNWIVLYTCQTTKVFVWIHLTSSACQFHCLSSFNSSLTEDHSINNVMKYQVI